MINDLFVKWWRWKNWLYGYVWYDGII